MTVEVPILHFNDVYRVNPQKIKGGATIDVTQFAYMLNTLREAWPMRAADGKRDGLVLFSGDLFAPSVESSVTRGSHMVSAFPAGGWKTGLTTRWCLLGSVR